MTVNASDIINKYNTTWISERLLSSVFANLNAAYFRTAARPRYKQSVPPCHQDKAVLPDTGKSWRWTKIDGQFYYAYANIPNIAPNAYRSQLPTEKELIAMAKETNTAAEPTTLSKFFEPYLKETYKPYLHFYGDCTPIQQTNLAKACALVEACVEYIKMYELNTDKNTFFKEVAELAQAEDWKYFPHNYRIIKSDRIMPVIEGKAIIEVVKLPRADNSNASQYDDAEVKSWVLQLREMGANYTNAFIIRKIIDVCTLSEKPAPSERWIGHIMESHQVKYLTASQRFGENGRFANIYKGYVPIANALFAGDCWQVDSTRFNIIPHKADDGKMRYINSICIRDVHSGDILGSVYDYSENRWAYISALQMAVQEAQYLPYEIVFDKFPGHNSPEFENMVMDLENRGVKVTFTSKTTGKARLERHFGTLQNVFMQDSNKYYGQGIKSRRNYAHRSEKYIKSMLAIAKSEGFDFEAACAEAETIINNYRSTPLCNYSRKYSQVEKSPKQLHIDSEKPNVLHVDEKMYAFIFGLKKVLPIRNQGLLVTEIHKTSFTYRITDHNIISRYSEVLVCYNLEDLSSCHLYEVSDKKLKVYLGTAQELEDVQIYGPTPQWGKMAKQQAIIRELEEAKVQDLQHQKAVGDDIVTFLTPGLARKNSYENAETAYTNRQLGVSTTTEVEPDEKPVSINVRHQY